MNVRTFAELVLNAGAVVCGLSLPLVIWNGPDNAEARLHENARIVSEMSAAEKFEIQPSFEQFSQLTDQQKQSIQEIQKATAQDPVLADRLHRFAEMATSPRYAKFVDHLPKIRNGEVSVADVNRELAAESAGQTIIRINPGKPLSPFATPFLPDKPVQFPVSDYLTLLQKTLPDSELTESEKTELGTFTQPEHLALVRSYQILNRIQRSFEQMRRPGGPSAELNALFRRFNDALSLMVSHQEIREAFARRDNSDPKMIAVRLLFLATAELEKSIPKPDFSDEALAEVYAQINDPGKRQRLMTDDPQDAKRELMMMATLARSSEHSSPEAVIWKKILSQRNGLPSILRQMVDRERFRGRRGGPSGDDFRTGGDRGPKGRGRDRQPGDGPRGDGPGGDDRPAGPGDGERASRPFNPDGPPDDFGPPPDDTGPDSDRRPPRDRGEPGDGPPDRRPPRFDREDAAR
ncbi:MAG: hypothetical protein ACK526_13840 [Planctomyces sp.]